MKTSMAVMACLLMDGLAFHSAIAQTQPRVHGAGYLGVGVAEIDDDRAKSLKLKEDYGVMVMSVGEDSPAAKAGLKESDVILEFNGQRVEGVEQFTRMVRETPAGRKVTLQIFRNGAAQTLTPTLTARNGMLRQDNHFEVRIPDMPDMPFGDLPMPPAPPRVYVPDAPRAVLSWKQATIGIEAESVSGQLADFFGVKEGVLVRSVTHNSPAEKGGLKAGDVVIRVDSNGVKSPQELSREVRASRKSNAPVTLTLMRNHREISVSLKPSENWDGDGDEN